MAFGIFWLFPRFRKISSKRKRDEPKCCGQSRPTIKNQWAKRRCVGRTSFGILQMNLRNTADQFLNRISPNNQMKEHRIFARAILRIGLNIGLERANTFQKIMCPVFALTWCSLSDGWMRTLLPSRDINYEKKFNGNKVPRKGNFSFECFSCNPQQAWAEPILALVSE